MKEKLFETLRMPIGELYLNSVDRDGTGNGLNMRILNYLPIDNTKPIILAGGVGNEDHLCEGLLDSRVDAISTANLLNFIGNGFHDARTHLIRSGLNLSRWR